MKFENVNEKYKREFQTYTTLDDEVALTIEFNSAQVSSMTHTMDNGWLDSSFGRTVKNLNNLGYVFGGYCLDAPYYAGSRTCAVIIEEESTFEKYWCHVSEQTIKWWKEQSADAGKLFNQ